MVMLAMTLGTLNLPNKPNFYILRCLLYLHCKDFKFDTQVACSYSQPMDKKLSLKEGHGYVKWPIFSARCNIYISRLCYDVSVRLSVRKSKVVNSSSTTWHCLRVTYNWINELLLKLTLHTATGCYSQYCCYCNWKWWCWLFCHHVCVMFSQHLPDFV